MSEFFIRLPHSWCGASVESVVEVAQAAEDLGFDGVSVQDHVLAGPGVAPCGHAHDGDDLGTATFSEPNWKPGDTVALADEVYRVRDVVYLDDEDGDVRGMLMLEERPR